MSSMRIFKHIAADQVILNLLLILNQPYPPITKGRCLSIIVTTMFIQRGETKLISGIFSAKLSKTQLNRTPCKIEGLTIKCDLKHFSPFIQESKHEIKDFADLKPCWDC